MHFFDLVGPLEPATEDLNGGSQKIGKLEYAKDHLAVEVSTNHVDLLLLVCCLVTGFIDSTVYSGMTLPNTTSGFADFSSIWYLCVYANRFESSTNKRLQTALIVSFTTSVNSKTGNTIIVAIGASMPSTSLFDWTKALSSISFFTIGSLIFSNFNRFFGARKRGTLASSFLLQSICILVASGMIDGETIDSDSPPTSRHVQWNQLALIALLSFQSAGQIVTSRALGLSEIPTVVITSLLCDLFSDTRLFDPFTTNVKRNRRAAAYALTIAGGIIGGWVSQQSNGVQTMLWAAGAVKCLLTLLWVCWL